MRFIGLAIAGVLLAAAPASAQYLDVPRPPAAIGPALLESAAEIVEAIGLNPVGPAIRSGPFLVQQARDHVGRLLRVTLDARRSQVIAVEPAGMPRGADAGYSSHDPYRAHYSRVTPEDGLAPPGSAMRARAPQGVLPQPHSAAASPDLPVPPMPGKPRTKAAAVTPQPPAPPTPRKRPAAAPQQAVGSVEPVAPQNAPAQTPPAAASPPPSAPANPPPAKPEGSAMPPVAPLE
jgi:hypothetical protein